MKKKVAKGYVFLFVAAKTPVETSDIIVPFESSSVTDHQESSFTMKRSVFMQSSSSKTTSSSTISTGTGATEPNVEVHSYSSQSEEKYEKIGDKPPVQVSVLSSL
jgi:hypothetical protein